MWLQERQFDCIYKKKETAISFFQPHINLKKKKPCSTSSDRVICLGVKWNYVAAAADFKVATSLHP